VALPAPDIRRILSSANIGSHAVSAAKLTALSKPRAIIRGRNTVVRPPPPTSARILNPEASRTITGSTFEHPSRPVSLSPPIRTKKATGVTTETHEPSLPLTKNGGSIRLRDRDWSVCLIGLLAGAVLFAWMAASAEAAETKVVYLRGMEEGASVPYRDTAGRQWTGWRPARDRR
jgi:hypothetical protein